MQEEDAVATCYRLTRSTLLPLGALRVAMTFNGATCPTGVAMMGRKARPWIASSRFYLRSLGGTYTSPSPPSLFVLNSMQTPVTQPLDPIVAAVTLILYMVTPTDDYVQLNGKCYIHVI